jgi:hypothetical protein
MDLRGQHTTFEVEVWDHNTIMSDKRFRPFRVSLNSALSKH